MLRTKSGLLKHCTYQLDRDGNRRVRFRRRGVSAYLTGIPWSEDFMRQYAALLERDQAQRAQVGAQPLGIFYIVWSVTRGFGIPKSARQGDDLLSSIPIIYLLTLPRWVRHGYTRGRARPRAGGNDRPSPARDR